MCVCGFISPYGDKAARHLLRCTEKSCYYMTAAAETVKDVAVCGKQESEEDKPRTLPSGEVRQNEGKEEVEGNYMIKKKKFITLHLSKQTLCKNDCLEQCIKY